MDVSEPRTRSIEIVAISLVAIVVVGIVDGYSSAYMTFSIFYVVPIFLAAWFGDRRMGLVAAALAALCGLGADLGSIGAKPLFAYVNVGPRLALFLLVAIVAARLRTAMDDQRQLAEDERVLAEQQREIGELRRALMANVVEGSREPLGAIYAKVVDLGFDHRADLPEEARDLLGELAEASKRVATLIDTLNGSTSTEPLETTTGSA